MIFNYEFEKNWWGFRWLKWVFNKDFAVNGDGFCPIFHLLWITVLLSPFVLIVKLFGSFGDRFLQFLESYKQNRAQQREIDFLHRCNNPNITKQEAYSLVKSRCFDKHSWMVKEGTRNKLIDMWHEYQEEINTTQAKSKIKRQKQYEEVKTSPLFAPLAYIITVSLLLIIGYLGYQLYLSIDFPEVDWVCVKNWGVGFLWVGGLSLFCWLFIAFIIVPIGKKLDCMECKLCKLGIGRYIVNFFRFIGKGVFIIGDMIYLTYKKACPQIKIK